MIGRHVHAPIAPQGAPTELRQNVPVQHCEDVVHDWPTEAQVAVWQVPAVAPAGIAQLVPVLSFSGDAPAIPNDIKANFAGQNVGVTKYKGGAINEPSAIYVFPPSFDAVCPSETKSAIAQLAIKLGDLINEIRGEPKTEENEAYRKPGLLEQADTLSKGLEKVGNGGK